MNLHDKPLVWLHGEIKTPPFSQSARLEAGFLLRRLQRGEKLSMENRKKKHLEEKGWKVGTAQEFLGLNPAEAEYVELKLMLSENLKKRRQQKRLNQMELAKLLKSSQSRVAQMEVGDPSISLDNLVRSLLMLGATKQDLARMIAPSERFVSTAL